MKKKPGKAIQTLQFVQQIHLKKRMKSMMLRIVYSHLIPISTSISSSANDITSGTWWPKTYSQFSNTTSIGHLKNPLQEAPHLWSSAKVCSLRVAFWQQAVSRLKPYHCTKAHPHGVAWEYKESKFHLQPIQVLRPLYKDEIQCTNSVSMAVSGETDAEFRAKPKF